jgi:hypothetical protein
VRRRDQPLRRHRHRPPPAPGRFDEQSTFEGFDFTASPGIPAAQIRDLAALRYSDRQCIGPGRS